MQAIPPRKDGRGCSSHMPSSRRTEQARSRDQETSASCAPTASVRVVEKNEPLEYSLAATKAGRPVDGCEGDQRVRFSYDVVKRYSAAIAPRRHTVYRPASARSTGGVWRTSPIT